MRWAAHIAVGAGLAAAVNPLTIPAAVIGVAWVNWSWSLLWILLLMMPATLASWLITLINKAVFGRDD